jgi:hypothetical protein
MAFLVVVINTGDSISDINSKAVKPTQQFEGVQGVRNYLDAALGGLKPASIQVTSRDTDPSVSTSGSGSAQTTYRLSK